MNTNNSPWQHRARCNGRDLSEFIPEGKLGIAAQRAHKKAVQFCGPCPVKRECLRFALDAEGNAPADSRFGVFGGMTPEQRHEMQLRLTGKQRKTRNTMITAA